MSLFQEHLQNAWDWVLPPSSFVLPQSGGSFTGALLRKPFTVFWWWEYQHVYDKHAQLQHILQKMFFFFVLYIASYCSFNTCLGLSVCHCTLQLPAWILCPCYIYITLLITETMDFSPEIALNLKRCWNWNHTLNPFKLSLEQTCHVTKKCSNVISFFSLIAVLGSLQTPP